MTNYSSRFAAIFCLGAWLLIGNARATTVIPPTFEAMADRAELILTGKTVASRAEWRLVGTNRVIFTLVEFEPEEVLKGKAGKSVTLQFLGGTVGETTLEVAGLPRFQMGERVILFVEKNGLQFCPLVGAYHGKFGLRKEAKSGREIVVRHDGKPLCDAAEMGAELGPKQVRISPLPDREPMSADDFKNKVREHLRKRAAQK